MITKVIIDLLAEEDTELSAGKPSSHIDDTFMPRHSGNSDSIPESGTEAQLSTRKKLDILGWASMDRQLKNYGSSKVSDLLLGLIDDDARKHITVETGSKSAAAGVFDFRSDSIPFAVKYNVAIALSCSEAIGILSGMDACEIYASEEVERVFGEHGRQIHPGSNWVNFDELPLDMKKELIWPMVQNIYRAMTIRKAAQVFPEGISGKLAYEALTSECENEHLAKQLSELDALKYSDYETVYFSDPSDLEVKYHVALYCLNHVGEIKPPQKKSPQEDETVQESEPTQEDEEQQSENIKILEEEYIAAFKRLNENGKIWDKLNLGNLFEMGKDVISAIKEEVKNFALLKQGIMSRLAGRSELAIENEELLRILNGQSPDFSFASQYLAMFFQPSDYYSILGLDYAAVVTEKDVKDAFKRQAKIYHPDKNSSDPDKDGKEQVFKLLIAAKDALLKKHGAGGKAPPNFRDNVSLTNYLGSISRLFEGYKTSEQDTRPRREEIKAELPQTVYQQREEDQRSEEAEFVQDIYRQDQEEVKMEIDESIIEDFEGEPLPDALPEEEAPVERDPEEEGSAVADSISESEYVGPYFEEMRLLRAMIDGWVGKEILIMGAGQTPDDFSMPVILARMGANVYAVDVNYRGPAEYQGCQYFRASVDRIDEMFGEKQFDIIISTAMFGVPFTNWAIREFGLNSFDEALKDRIKELELEVLRKLLISTKKDGVHFHHNRDMNPQSWTFSEDELKQIGYEVAFHSEDLPSPEETWFLKK